MTPASIDHQRFARIKPTRCGRSGAARGAAFPVSGASIPKVVDLPKPRAHDPSVNVGRPLATSLLTGPWRQCLSFLAYISARLFEAVVGATFGRLAAPARTTERRCILIPRRRRRRTAAAARRHDRCADPRHLLRPYRCPPPMKSAWRDLMVRTLRRIRGGVRLYQPTELTRLALSIVERHATAALPVNGRELSPRARSSRADLRRSSSSFTIEITGDVGSSFAWIELAARYDKLPIDDKCWCCAAHPLSA